MRNISYIKFIHLFCKGQEGGFSNHRPAPSITQVRRTAPRGEYASEERNILHRPMSGSATAALPERGSVILRWAGGLDAVFGLTSDLNPRPKWSGHFP